MRDKHSGWTYLLWTDQNVPKMPKHAQDLYEHFYKEQRYCYASDILRYYLLVEHGGVYIDCDFQLSENGSLDLLPLDKNTILVNQRKQSSRPNVYKYRIQSCFIASVPHATFLQKVFDNLGKEPYILTNLKRVPLKQYNCQYLTTEFWAHIKNCQAIKAVHVIRKNITALIPKDECVLDSHYFFGQNALIAKHLYEGDHGKDQSKSLNRQRLISRLNLTGVGIEIGVQRGVYSESILQNSNLHLILLDSWRYFDEYKSICNKPTKDQIELLVKTINNLVDKYEGRFTIMRERSEVAVNFFADEMFDFIYLDADHSEKFVYNQLVTWWPKLKRGGWMAGHDYIPRNTKTFGVKAAVDRFFAEQRLSFSVTEEYGLPSWYIQKQ